MEHQITVTFSFNGETNTVSKLNCFVNGVESKKKTTKTKDIVLEDKAILTLESNKIQLNNKAVSDMKLEWEDRIVIKYEKIEGTKKFFPTIALGEEGVGNKLTKTNSVIFKGKANTILSQYGNEFELEPFKEGVWKLVTIGGLEPNAYEAIEEKVESLDVTIPVEDTNTEEDINLNEITFKL